MDDYQKRICAICADILNLYSEMDRDMQRVIHCEDCRWRELNDTGWFCAHPDNSDGGMFMAVRATGKHYCGRAERRQTKCVIK